MTVLLPASRASAPAAAIARPAPPAALDGERLAVATTAAGVALLPLLVPAGPANVAPVDLLVALAIAAVLFWAGSSRRRLRFPYIAGSGLLMAGGALGAIAGPVPRTGILALVQDVMLLLWCWAVFNVASSAPRLRVVMAAWAYAALAWAALLLVGLVLGLHFITGQNASEGTRTSLTFGDPNFAANYWVLSITLLWATGRPRRRPARVLGYGLLLAALVSTGSNGGLISLLGALAVGWVVVAYSRFGLPAAAVVLAALVLGGSLLAPHIHVAALQERAHTSHIAVIRDGVGHGQEALSSRSTVLGESIRLWHDSGVLGSGPVSTKARLVADMAPYVKEAHDDYAAALVERGAIGFLGLVVLIATLGLRAPGLMRARLSPAYAAAVPHPHALIGGLAGTLMAMAVLELLHARHVWTLFALVAAIAVWGRR